MQHHLDKSHAQVERLDRLLAALGTSSSALKDAAMSFMGNVAALAHAPASDEVIKNSLANYAFEHYKIAGYKSLIAIAEEVGDAEAITLWRVAVRGGGDGAMDRRTSQGHHAHLPASLRARREGRAVRGTNDQHTARGRGGRQDERGQLPRQRSAEHDAARGSRVAEHTKEAHEGKAEDDAVAGEAKPMGHPTSDRYDAETAAARQSGVHPPERDPKT